jgi:hypothetical protein
MIPGIDEEEDQNNAGPSKQDNAGPSNDSKQSMGSYSALSTQTLVPNVDSFDTTPLLTPQSSPPTTRRVGMASVTTTTIVHQILLAPQAVTAYPVFVMAMMNEVDLGMEDGVMEDGNPWIVGPLSAQKCVGLAVAYISALLYIGSRIPQILKNVRDSTMIYVILFAICSIVYNVVNHVYCERLCRNHDYCLVASLVYYFISEIIVRIADLGVCSSS